MPKLALDAEKLLILAAVGGGLYLAYQAVKGVKAVAGAAADAGVAVYHGAQALTAPVSSGIANVVLQLTAQPAMGGVLGNVIFPDGTGAPLSSYRVYTDQAGNVYVKQSGSTWQLGPSDPDGDWPATYVSG